MTPADRDPTARGSVTRVRRGRNAARLRRYLVQIPYFVVLLGLLAAAVLVPPSILAATDPGLFLPALDAAGTFGITLLFGIIPAACVWRLRQDENSEVFVPGGEPVLASMVGLSAFVIGEGALDALGLV